MRLPRRGATLAITALGFALAACAEGTTPGEAPSGGPATGTPTAGGKVASCVVGNWRTSGLEADAQNNRARADLTGGEGINVQISDTGRTTIDFATMAPITFDATVANADVRGRFTYSGTASGQVATGPAPTATSTGGTAPSGTWAPVGDLNWGDTRLTVELTEPVQAKPFDNTPIGRYVGDGTGNAVDIDPFFDRGTYRCSGDTLTVTPDEDADIPWTLKRV